MQGLIILQDEVIGPVGLRLAEVDSKSTLTRPRSNRDRLEVDRRSTRGRLATTWMGLSLTSAIVGQGFSKIGEHFLLFIT